MTFLPFDHERSSRDAFERFHAAHPEVYREFARVARILKNRGHTHYSADGIMHVVRFNTKAGDTSGRGFKINNNHVADYARMLIRDDPEFESFFKTRRRRRAG